MSDSKSVPVDVVKQHQQLHRIYPYDVLVDEAGTITRFADVSRFAYNLTDPNTSHADMCLSHWLSNKALWGSTETQTNAKHDAPNTHCHCALVNKMNKVEQSDAMYGVAPHVQPLRTRRLALFDRKYKNFLKGGQ